MKGDRAEAGDVMTDETLGHHDTRGLPSALVSLDRFLAKLLEDSWLEISGNLGGGRGRIVFSGILPLKDPWLIPFMDKPGVYLLMGPIPDLRIMAIGHSQAPMASAVIGRVDQFIGGKTGSGGKEAGKSEPSYLACVSMEEEWTLVRPFWALLTRRIREQRKGMRP